MAVRISCPPLVHATRFSVDIDHEFLSEEGGGPVSVYLDAIDAVKVGRLWTSARRTDGDEARDMSVSAKHLGVLTFAWDDTENVDRFGVYMWIAKNVVGRGQMWKLSSLPFFDESWMVEVEDE